MNEIASKPKINETTAMQIACVIAWLWGAKYEEIMSSYHMPDWNGVERIK